MDTTQDYVSTRQRKILIDKISQLTETEHREIYKLLAESNNIGFTQNRNGIFINFKLVPGELVRKIELFVEFCNSNRAELDAYDKHINECKLNKDISKVLMPRTSEHNEVNDNEVSHSLHEVIVRENKTYCKKSEWVDMVKDCKEKERVTNYVESLENNFAKIHKKKTCNMKYANAKKKYARKVIAEKKFDIDLASNLEKEKYILEPAIESE